MRLQQLRMKRSTFILPWRTVSTVEAAKKIKKLGKVKTNKAPQGLAWSFIITDQVCRYLTSGDDHHPSSESFPMFNTHLLIDVDPINRLISRGCVSTQWKAYTKDPTCTDIRHCYHEKGQ